MAQYQLSFENTPLGTYPAELTRRWATNAASPVVEAHANSPLGLTRSLVGKNTGNSRQFDSVTAIESDPDRATVKFRALIFTPGAASNFPNTNMFAAVLRGTGSAGTETGYAFTLTQSNASTCVLGINRYSGGTLTTNYNSFSGSWQPNTWYVAEGEVSGSTTVELAFRIYELSDLETPIATHTRTDTDAGRIESAGWAGVGRFAANLLTRHAYVAFATGSSELPVPPWEGADTEPPTLTGPTGTATGETTASGAVSTNEANGTLYYLASANATESVATVKAGSSKAVTAVGAQNVTVSGLTASTSYYLHFVHTDAAANDSAVATSAQFTTNAPSGDTDPPSLTGAVTFTSITQTGYTANWPAGSDNVAVTGYEHQIGGTAGAWTDAGNNLSAVITGRTAGATETVYVRAYDAAGLRSTPAISGEVTLESAPALTKKLRIDETLYTDKAKTATFSGTANVTVLDRAATRAIVYQANAVTITAGALDITNAAFETLAAQFDVVVVVSGTVRGVFPATVVED